MTILLALLIGFAAGVTSGMFGVGGGILFVPTLVLVVGLTQIEAESTSLLAMIPVAAVGAYRQYRYGNVNLKVGVLVGLFSVPGVIAGTALSNDLTNRQLEVAFGCLMLVMAALLVRRALKKE